MNILLRMKEKYEINKEVLEGTSITTQLNFFKDEIIELNKIMNKKEQALKMSEVLKLENLNYQAYNSYFNRNIKNRLENKKG